MGKCRPGDNKLPPTYQRCLDKYREKIDPEKQGVSSAARHKSLLCAVCGGHFSSSGPLQRGIGFDLKPTDTNRFGAFSWVCWECYRKAQRSA